MTEYSALAKLYCQGKLKYPEKKTGPVPLCPPQSPHALPMANIPDNINQIFSTQKWINLICSTNY